MSRLTSARSRLVERRGVVEVVAERVRHGGVLGEDLQVETLRPPAAVAAALGRVGGAAAVVDRASALGRLARVLVHLADDGVVVVLGVSHAPSRSRSVVQVRDVQAGHRPQ